MFIFMASIVAEPFKGIIFCFNCENIILLTFELYQVGLYNNVYNVLTAADLSFIA
jgi:hypothetical protein